MQIAVYGLLLIIVIIAMFGLRHMSKGHTTGDNTAKEDTIHAAVVYGPNSYRVLTSEDGNDSIIGINYHLLKGLEKELGVKLMLHPVIDREDAMRKVKEGEYDILASLPADLYLKDTYLTTGDIYLDRMVLLQRRNPNGTLSVRSSLDLDGDTIHVEK
ncbi:MAG: hypothetical protein K2H72_07685, partial [Muribaculaceae bacterium]|nr:hypothetical protein [Muribaculaceae bacterium]